MLLLFHTEAFNICNPALKAKPGFIGLLEFSYPDDKHTYYTLLLYMQRDTNCIIVTMCKTGQFFTSSQLLESQRHISIHRHNLKESNTRNWAAYTPTKYEVNALLH